MIMSCPIIYHPNLRVWETIDDYLYLTADNVAIHIQAGFLFDLASIPRVLWAVVSSFELGVESALVHDYLYSTKGLHGRFTRAECDGIFYQIMAQLDIDIFIRAAAYRAVRDFGASHWQGEPDPAEKSEPGPPNGKLFT